MIHFSPEIIRNIPGNFFIIIIIKIAGNGADGGNSNKTDCRYRSQLHAFFCRENSIHPIERCFNSIFASKGCFGKAFIFYRYTK